MYCKKPVIATDYSANAEFMTVNNSFPVKYELKKLESDFGLYQKGSSWAEPDVSHAAELMRFVFENTNAASETGKRAASDARELFGAEYTGRRMKQRLDYISFLNDDFRKASDSKETHSKNIEVEIEKLKQAEKINYLEEKIALMKQSKFWKIRDQWWKLKGIVKNRD